MAEKVETRVSPLIVSVPSSVSSTTDTSSPVGMHSRGATGASTTRAGISAPSPSKR